MDEKVIDLLLDIKKELQDIRSILEPKKVTIKMDGKGLVETLYANTRVLTTKDEINLSVK